MSNRVPASERREKISISPDPRVLSWIDARVGLGLTWASRTHAFEWCVAQQMDRKSREGLAVAESGAPKRSKYVKPRP